ncbi:ArsR/SmtB family transcription factor [Actinomadura viridis]|uniref:ArsR/SmtB family transcription factor n=1 Tax=Actinomadura viridis TaxID=58110 RepID=UPI0036C67075
MNEATAGDDVPASGSRGLSPLRRRLLEELTRPASASELAERLGLTRQRVNYHLRELERLGLVELAGERRRRGFIERRMRAVERDRYSSGHLLATASSLAEDVAILRERARAAGRPVLTFTLEVEIDFTSPAAMRDFCDQAGDALRRLAAHHHSPGDPKARRHRIVVGAHPVITKSAAQAAAESAEAAEDAEPDGGAG